MYSKREFFGIQIKQLLREPILIADTIKVKVWLRTVIVWFIRFSGSCLRFAYELKALTHINILYITNEG